MLGCEAPCFNSWGEILSQNIRPGNESSPDTSGQECRFIHSCILGLWEWALGLWVLDCDLALKLKAQDPQLSAYFFFNFSPLKPYLFLFYFGLYFANFFSHFLFSLETFSMPQGLFIGSFYFFHPVVSERFYIPLVKCWIFPLDFWGSASIQTSAYI